jgi:predicted phage tail protein
MGLFTKGTFWALIVGAAVVAIRFYMPGIPVEDSVLATLLMSGVAAALLAFGIKVDMLTAQKKELEAKLGAGMKAK